MADQWRCRLIVFLLIFHSDGRGRGPWMVSAKQPLGPKATGSRPAFETTRLDPRPTSDGLPECTQETPILSTSTASVRSFEEDTSDRSLIPGGYKKDTIGWITDDVEDTATQTHGYRDRAYEQSVVDFALSVCQISCGRWCNSPFYVFARFDGSCSCDNKCQIYGNCCLDYYMNCDVPPLVDGEIPADNASFETRLEHHADRYSAWLQTQYEHPTSSCKVMSLGTEFISISIVDRCPEEISPSLEGYRLSCENPEMIENILDRFTLVRKPSIGTRVRASTFSNIYCARCNGVFLNQTSVRSIQPRFDCEENTKQAEIVLRQVGHEAFMQFLAANCTPIYDESIRERHLECISAISFVDSCNKSLSGIVTDFEDIARACKVYRQDIIRNNDSPVIYKNPYCALCNGVSNFEVFQCLGKKAYKNATEPDRNTVKGFGSFPSFAILMDFSSSRYEVTFDNNVLCPAGYFLNMSNTRQHRCLKNNCPIGEMLLHGNCSKLHWEFDTALPPEMRETYTVINRLENTTGVTELAPTLLALAYKMIDRPIGHVNVSIDPSCEFLTKTEESLGIAIENQTNDVTSDICVLVEVSRQVLDNSSFWKLIESTYKLIKPPNRMPDSAKQFKLEMVERGFSWQMVRSVMFYRIYLLNHSQRPTLMTQQACREGSKQVTSQGDSVTLIEHNDKHGFSSLMFHLTDTNLELSFEMTPALLSWKPSPKHKMFVWPMALLVSHCQPSILTCQKVLFSRADVIFTTRGTLRMKGHSTDIGQSEFAQVGENHIIVCRTAASRSVRIKSKSSRLESLLTFAGVSFSLLGLAITLITYALFSVLRTRPGLCIVCLSASLFASQALFTIGPQLANSDFNNFCIILGSVQHYSWLAAFFWMNVLAVDAAITFSSKVNTPSQKTYPLRFRLFLLYAFGSPALIVSVCLIMDQLNVVSFDYINPGSCWLTSGRTLLLGFGLPLAVVVLLNIILFVKSTVALNTTMNIANHATVSKRNDIQRLLMYTKLFCVMGISWFLGFLSAATGLQWMAYLYILFNSSQGVFICLSFVFTARVRAMYKNPFGRSGTTDDTKQALASSELKHSSSY